MFQEYGVAKIMGVNIIKYKMPLYLLPSPLYILII